MAEVNSRGLRPRRRSSPDGWVNSTHKKLQGWRKSSGNPAVSTPKESRFQPQPPNKACAAVRCVSILETLMEVGGGDATQEEVGQVTAGEDWRTKEGKGGEGGRNRKKPGRSRRERGTTPDWIRKVLEVAKRGDVEELRHCLGGMDPTLVRNLSDHSGNNLLHIVAGRGHVGALAWLCGVDSCTPTGNSNLLEAALLDENRAGLTPIGVAIKNGRVGVVEWLLRQGEARLMSSSSGGISGSAATLSRRLWPGSQVSVGPGVGEPSPLHLAAKYGQDRLLRWLLKRSGVQQRRPAASVLHPSHINRSLNRSLDSGLNHGSNDWKENNEENAFWKDLIFHSPLCRELKFGPNWSDVNPETEQSAEIPGINQCDHRGRTPLHLAAKAGNMNTCRILLSHGADISLKSELGRKASGCAFSRGHNALSSWLSLWEAALTLATQLAAATELLADVQKQNQELRGHFREVLIVGKRLAKERDEICRELGEAVRGAMPEHPLIARLHKAHFSGSLADMEHRLLLAEQWWRQVNGRTRNAPSQPAQAMSDGKKALQMLLTALSEAEAGVGDVVHVQGVGELSSSSSSVSCSSASSSMASCSSSPRTSSKAPCSSCSDGQEGEEEQKLMALSLDAVYSEIEEQEETRRRKSCDFGLLLGIGEASGTNVLQEKRKSPPFQDKERAMQEVDLRQRIHGLSLTSESGNASVLEVIEPPDEESVAVGHRPRCRFSQSKPSGRQVSTVSGGRRRGRIVERSPMKPLSKSSTVPWDVMLHRSVSETTINRGLPMEEEGEEEDRSKGLSVSVEDLLGERMRKEESTKETPKGRGRREVNVPSTSSDPVVGRSRQAEVSAPAAAEGRTSAGSHSSASSSSANSRPDILAGTSPQIAGDELSLSVVCDVPDVGSESCGEAGISGSSGISPISVGLLPVSNNLSGLKKRNFLQKLSAKARWPSTKRKKMTSPVGLSPSLNSLTSSPSSGGSGKRSQEISPEDFKETYLSPRMTNGTVECTQSPCQESPRLTNANCPTEDSPDGPTKSLLGRSEGEEVNSVQTIPAQTLLAVAPVTPICDRHGSPGSSMGGHRASQVRAELASVAASEDSGIMMAAPPRPSSSASLPSSSSSCYYSAATRAREAAVIGGGGMVAMEEKLSHGNGHRTLASYHLKCVNKRIGPVAEPFLMHPEKALEAYLGRTRVQQQRQKGVEDMSLPHTPPPPRPPAPAEALPSPLPTVPHLSPVLSERGVQISHREESSAGIETVQMAGVRNINCDSVDIRSQDVSSLASQSVEEVDTEEKSQNEVIEQSTEGAQQIQANEIENSSQSTVRPWYDLSEEEEEEERGGEGSSGLSGLSVVRSSSEEEEELWRQDGEKEGTLAMGSAVSEHEAKSAL